MSGYEVRLHDSVQNTGLDSAVFAKREEADRAALLVRTERRCSPEVAETDRQPNITYAEWDSQGW